MFHSASASQSREHTWIRRLVTLGTIAATSAGLTLGIAGPASAADQQQLAGFVAAGAKKPVVAENYLLNGHSTWRVPAGHGPRQDAFLPAFGYGLSNPDVAPPGANDWTCKPHDGQRPVVLVHGTWENAYNNWAMVSPALKERGRCVYALNYGILSTGGGGGVAAVLPGAYATGDIAKSGAQIGRFVTKVLAATGADKVDMVGHSQGGLVARQYLKFDGGQSKVDHLITLGATNHGTTLDGIGAVGRTINNLGIDVLGPIALGVGVAGIQQVYGSTLLKKLNAGGDTVPGVHYTVIGSRYDEVTTPYQSTFLRGPDVRNITLQNGCPADVSDHVSMSYSPRATSLVLHALDPSVPVICAPNAWLFG